MRADDADDDARRRLRDLQRRLEQAEDLYDRFGDPRVDASIQRLHAEIAALPAHIRQEAEVGFKLELLTRTVEDYLVARAAQFLPDIVDADAVWAAVQALLEHRDAPETPAARPVVALLDELRPLPASDEAVRNAVRAAAALESFQQPVYRQRSGARRMNPPRDYHQSLRQQVRAFLTKAAQEGASRSGLPPLDDSRALIALVRTWQEQTPDEARAGTYWIRFARQAILSDANVLRRLGLSDAEINSLMEAAYNQWRTRR